MQDPELNRINELKFLELCTRLRAYRNKPTDIATYLKALEPLIAFDARIIYELSQEIFDMKYIPNKYEVMYIMKYSGLALPEMAKAMNIAGQTAYNWLKEALTLFPRASKVQLKALNQFITQYDKLCTIDMRNIL